MNWSLLWAKIRKLEQSSGGSGSGLPVVEIPMEFVTPVLVEGTSVALTNEISAKFEEAVQLITPVIVKIMEGDMGVALVANLGMTSDAGMTFSCKFEAGEESFVLLFASAGGPWYVIPG